MKPKRFSRRTKLILGTMLMAVACAWTFGFPYRAVEPLPTGILDMHCHVAGIGAGDSGCFVSDQLRNSWKFRIYLRSFGTSKEELLERGDQIVPERVSEMLKQSRYVNRVVILALDGVIDSNGSLDTNSTEVYIPNSFVADAVARHTNLLFGASVNPYRTNALDQLIWAKEHGAVLVKWIPSIMHIDPADPKLTLFYEKLVELNLPLLSHTGNERSFSGSTDEYCDPDRLRLPLQLGVRVIAAHIASTGKFQGQRSTDRLAVMMGQFTNLFTDISSLTQINKRFYMKEALLRSEFEGRLLYGSDFPLINTALVSPWYYSFRLSPRQIWRIARTDNPWDADVLLKQQLGTPAKVFTRSSEVVKNSDGL